MWPGLGPKAALGRVPRAHVILATRSHTHRQLSAHRRVLGGVCPIPYQHLVLYRRILLEEPDKQPLLLPRPQGALQAVGEGPRGQKEAQV